MSNPVLTTQRFQTWELDGFGQIKGIWQIPDGHEPHTYVELIRDGDTVVKIREHAEDSAKPLIRKPVFKNGHLAYTDYIDPTARLKGRNRYAYGKSGLLRAREERDPKGKLRFKVEIRCDDKGRFTQEKLHDRLGRLKERHVYEYGSDGKICKDTVYKGESGEALEGHFTFAHDDLGHLIRQAWHGADGIERSTFSYAYDEHHRQIEMRIERDGSVATTARTRFDDKGRRITTEYTSAKGSVIGTETVSDDGVVASELQPAPAPAPSPEDRALLGGARTLADIVDVSREQLSALSMIAYSHFENGRYEEARALYESLVALDPDEPYYFAAVAATAVEQDALPTALQWYERSLIRDPTHLPSLAGKAETELRMGDVDRALQTFETVLSTASDPSDPLVQRCRGIVLAISRAG